MIVTRKNTNILCNFERLLVRLLVSRVPDWCTSDHLTFLSCFGAIIGGISLICCWISPWFLVTVELGLLLNWLGDSLDGAVARYRRCERHRIGFIMDRAADVLSFLILLIAFGCSPYMTILASLFLLVIYLLHTIYMLIRAVVDGVHEIGFGGLGATEGRILVGLWAISAQFTGTAFVRFNIYSSFSVFDIVYAVGLVGAVCLFIKRGAADVRRIELGSQGDASRGPDSLPVNVVAMDRGRLPKTDEGVTVRPYAREARPVSENPGQGQLLLPDV